MTVRIEAPARNDLAERHGFYEKHEEGLGGYFFGVSLRFFREVHVSARNSRGGFRSVIARSALGLRQFFALWEGMTECRAASGFASDARPQSGGEPPQSKSGLRPRNDVLAGFRAKRSGTAAILCRSGGGRPKANRHPDLEATPAPKAVKNPSSPKSGLRPRFSPGSFFPKASPDLTRDTNFPDEHSLLRYRIFEALRRDSPEGVSFSLSSITSQVPVCQIPRP